MELKAACGLAVTVVALTSCGGSESGGAEGAAREGSPPPEARLSKAQVQYVERLDTACKEGDEVSNRVQGQMERLRRRPLPRSEMNKRVVELLDQSYVKSDRIRKRIGGIDPPPGEERFRRRYLAYSDRLDTLNKRARDAIARGEQLLGDDFLSLRRKIRRVTKQRGALVADHGGFRYCG